MSGCAAEYLKERIMAAAAAAAASGHDSVDAMTAMRFSDELINHQIHQHQIQQQLLSAGVGAEDNLDTIDTMNLRQRYIDASASKYGFDWEMRICQCNFFLIYKI